MKRFKATFFTMVLATTAFAQEVIDVHSHIIPQEFVSSLGCASHEIAYPRDASQQNGWRDRLGC